jgi:hypothetical protein
MLLTHYCRCIEHAVHIAAKHFVGVVAPTPQKTLSKKIRTLLTEACSSGELDESDLAQVLSTLGGGDDDVEGEEGADEWTAGDAVGKILALIKQVWVSRRRTTIISDFPTYVDPHVASST